MFSFTVAESAMPPCNDSVPPSLESMYVVEPLNMIPAIDTETSTCGSGRAPLWLPVNATVSPVFPSPG